MRSPDRLVEIAAVCRFTWLRRTVRAAFPRNWNEAMPRCGADLVGYFSPHEGSSMLACGVYHIASLAEYEAYRARLAADPLGRAKYEFAQREKFLPREDRIFLKRVSIPNSGR